MTLTLLVLTLALAAPEDFISGPIEVVAEGFKFTEGPIWLPDGVPALPGGVLAFSDVQADTIYLEDKSVFRKPSSAANGLTLDAEGRLVICQQQTGSITRLEADGSVTVLADRYEGKRLNAPNDVMIRSDGTIFFTDPMKRGKEVKNELDFSGVFAISPDGTLHLLVDSMTYPNGIALSPDETTLYVGDVMGAEIRAFDLDGTAVRNERVFCKANIPDGMKVDVQGNLWVASSRGIVVFDKAGALLETIRFPVWPANLAFGGADSKTLYVTARTKVFKARTAIAGIRPGMAKTSEE